MAEYVYKLRGDDLGWKDTVEGWAVTYRPFLLGLKIDCGDFASDFVSLLEEALYTSRANFCSDEDGIGVGFEGGFSGGLIPGVVLGMTILLAVYLVVASRRT
jgi:hypothetical protein